jgi:hypothetical protein
VATWQVNEVQRALKGADYPMSGKELSELAKSNGAEQELVDRLAEIDGTVGGPNGVMKELKGELGGPTPGPTREYEHKDVEGPAWQVNEVQRYLKGADYPATGEQLAELAKSNGAEQELVDALAGIDRTIEGPNGVMKELKDHLGGPTGGD